MREGSNRSLAPARRAIAISPNVFWPSIVFRKEAATFPVTKSQTISPAVRPVHQRNVASTQCNILLEIERLTRGKAVREVSLQLRCGEILGLAGLVGSGRSEVVRMIFGADRPDRGRMRLAGAEFAPNSPQPCSVAAR
jgi:ABC-type sugar transport system ATPase subunit